MTRSIAVIVQNRPFFGALLVHAPLLTALRRQHPDRPIVAYAPFEAARLLREWGLVDRVVVYRHAVPLWRALRAQRPDRVVSLRRKSLRVSLAVAASGARETVGFRYRLNGALLRRSIPLDKRIYRALAFLRLAEPLGVPDDADARAFVAHLAETSSWRPPGGGHVHTLVPCCSDERKQWGLENYLAYCRGWIARDATARFVFVLGPRERPLEAEIGASDIGERSTCLVEADTATIARAALESRVTITNDCAPGHLAQMSGRPVVCVFGNWDGRAEARMGEWFFGRPGAIGISTRDARPISTIAADAVVDAAAHVSDRAGAGEGALSWL